MMTSNDLQHIFLRETLADLLPPEASNHFFEALFGDPAEGAYDIALAFLGLTSNGTRLDFELQLHQRPGHCLACNLTQGLPQVFSRHPVLDIAGLVQRIVALLPGQYRCQTWQLGRTRQHSRTHHAIPLSIDIASS